MMSSDQRYQLHKAEIEKRYSQNRTYQPFFVNSEEGIEFKGKTSFVINVPIEQLESTPIPDDLKTASDLIKWGIGAGLIGYGMHQLSDVGSVKTTNTTINNNAAAAQ